MSEFDRRRGNRVPLEIFLNEYVHDRAHRALTVNISETGLYVNRVLTPLVRPDKGVALEFALPETGETIWARGEVCHDTVDPHLHGQGIRFTGMARMHTRLLRQWCTERRRARMAYLLDRIRRRPESLDS